MIDSRLQHTETRRGLVRKILGGAAALTIAGAVVASGLPTPVSAGSTYYKATTALNLRSQANTTSAVILVIPQGGQVMQAGPDLNGFKKVTHSGKTGYASSKYLVAVNDSPGGGDIPAYVGMATTKTSVNMRSGAGTSYSVLRMLPQGAKVEVYDKVANSFRLVRYQGQYGYVHTNYLTLIGGGPVVTPLTAMADLTMYGQISPLGRVLLVVPTGAKVTVKVHDPSGWSLVTYNNVTGYVNGTLLK